MKKDKNIRMTYVNEQLINAIKQYDIIYVKMSYLLIKEQGILKHTKRPFIVENVTKKYIKGYYLTGSTDNYCKMKSNKLIIKRKNYDLEKDSLVRCDKIEKLPYKNVLGIIDHLNNMDIAMLKKYRALAQGKTIDSNKDNPILEVGDMIFYNNKSYVILRNDNDLTAYNIFCDNNDSDLCFDFGNQKYVVDYTKKIHLNIDDEATIISRLNEYSLESINKTIDKLNKDYRIINMNNTKLEIKNIELGDVILLNNKNYLVYQMDSTMIYGYNINQTSERIKSKNGDKNPEIISIDNKNYYLDYSDNVQLKRKDEYDIIARLGSKAAKEAIEAKQLYKFINKCKKKSKKRPRC